MFIFNKLYLQNWHLKKRETKIHQYLGDLRIFNIMKETIQWRSLERDHPICDNK